MKRIINCTNCGKRFTATRSDQIRCPECRKSERIKRAYARDKAKREAQLKTMKCEYCGKEFKQRRGNQRYCTPKCARLMARSSQKYDIYPDECKPRQKPQYSIRQICAFQSEYKEKTGVWLGYTKACKMIESGGKV